MKTSSTYASANNIAAQDSTRVVYTANSEAWCLEPMRAAFGAGAVHFCYAPGPWDLVRVAETFIDQIVRSHYTRQEHAEHEGPYWVDLCIQLEELLFVRVSEDNLAVYATSAEAANTTAERFAKTFQGKAKVQTPTFQIVKKGSYGIDTEAVPLDGQVVEGELDLYYGENFQPWHERFLQKLTTRQRGLTIFDGPPGTGKTSYIRHLMRALRESHRFYFIGSANLGLLRDSEFVDFWASERRLNEGSSFVVILEDAESVLMSRMNDNRQEVSLLLNLTDGILGEFLKLQVICTINCDVQVLDSALLRPGRLLEHRHFGKLSHEQAEALARKLGKTLPRAEEYTLAEVFNEKIEAVPKKKLFGFAQN